MSHLTQNRVHWSLTASSTAECITVREAADTLRLDVTYSDAVLERAIEAARLYLEKTQGLQILTATLVMVLDEFPDVIRLPRYPVTSVTSITYTDTDGTTQTLSASNYRLDSASLGARVTPAYNKTWPSTRTETGAVTVTFIAGYADAASVPSDVKDDLLADVLDRYLHPSSTSERRVEENVKATARREATGVPTVA